MPKHDLHDSDDDTEPEARCHCGHVRDARQRIAALEKRNEELEELRLDKLHHEWGLLRKALTIVMFAALAALGKAMIDSYNARHPADDLPPARSGDRLGIDRVPAPGHAPEPKP